MIPINHAIQIYNKNKVDFAELLKCHLAYGVVVSLPDCFMFGYFCDRNKPMHPKLLEKSDCVFVTLCVGNMRQAALQIVELVPWVAYKREFKGDTRIRITNFKKLFKKL
jgi:hypothetical protein